MYNSGTMTKQRADTVPCLCLIEWESSWQRGPVLAQACLHARGDSSSAGLPWLTVHGSLLLAVAGDVTDILPVSSSLCLSLAWPPALPLLGWLMLPEPLVSTVLLSSPVV